MNQLLKELLGETNFIYKRITIELTYLVACQAHTGVREAAIISIGTSSSGGFWKFSKDPTMLKTLINEVCGLVDVPSSSFSLLDLLVAEALSVVSTLGLAIGVNYSKCYVSYVSEEMSVKVGVLGQENVDLDLLKPPEAWIRYDDYDYGWNGHALAEVSDRSLNLCWGG
ncbi:hypothetical protein VNO77_37887 [Canavalia gladiata]|uniref:Uncharacterized protein n=1 Tax=Canavalia gladiata TaxID=3824 RepID=A0AAN9PYP2_CANGL